MQTSSYTTDAILLPSSTNEKYQFGRFVVTNDNDIDAPNVRTKYQTCTVNPENNQQTPWAEQTIGATQAIFKVSGAAREENSAYYANMDRETYCYILSTKSNVLYRFDKFSNLHILGTLGVYQDKPFGGFIWKKEKHRDNLSPGYDGEVPAEVKTGFSEKNDIPSFRHIKAFEKIKSPTDDISTSAAALVELGSVYTATPSEHGGQSNDVRAKEVTEMSLRK